MPWVGIAKRLDGASGIGDLAYMVRAEIGEQRALLSSRVAEGEPWQIVDACRSSLGRLVTGMVIVERELSSWARRHPRLGFESQLARSLEVRRSYGTLRQAILRFGENPRQPEEAMREASNALGALAAGAVYRLLRVSDRVELEGLRTRLDAHLAEAPTADPSSDVDSAAPRLWQDIYVFARLLSSVNRREVLLAHDRQLAQELLAALGQAGDSAVVPGALRRRLGRLQGCDDNLDALLEDAAWLPKEAVRRYLEGIEQRVHPEEPASDRASA